MRFGSSILLVALLAMTGCHSGGGDVDAGDPSAWDLRPAAADTPLLAVSEQRRGVYPVGSRVRDSKALGGFGPCARYPKDLGQRDWGAAGKVSLVAFPDEAVHFSDYLGLAVRLANRTDYTVAFQASDSCLYLVQEAKIEVGGWRPIESLKETFCGNSYHRVFLKPNQY
jgi:hypothetical protein